MSIPKQKKNFSYQQNNQTQKKMSKRASAAAAAASLSWKNYVHPLTTALLAWAISANAFPQAPRLFQEFAKSELFRYFLVFVLVYQGGAKQNVSMALMVTVGMFLLSKILDLRAIINSIQPRQPTIMVMPAMPAPAPVTQPAQETQPTTEGFCCGNGPRHY